jgi:hypothetical protein
LTKVKKWALGTALVVMAAAVIASIVGPPTLRPWLCHQTPQRATPEAAIKAYYASCWFGPRTLEAMGDAGKESTGYASWFALEEFSAVYRDGKTRFMFVGKKSTHTAWRALPPEGSGP